jgi:hypothetical protein
MRGANVLSANTASKPTKPNKCSEAAEQDRQRNDITNLPRKDHGGVFRAAKIPS